MELDLRGTELDTMKEYLTLLGGVEQPEGHFVGAGWTVHLTPGIHRFRDWVFPRVVLVFAGDSDSVAEIVRQLRVMAMRGGA